MLLNFRYCGWLIFLVGDFVGLLFIVFWNVFSVISIFFRKLYSMKYEVWLNCGVFFVVVFEMVVKVLVKVCLILWFILIEFFESIFLSRIMSWFLFIFFRILLGIEMLVKVVFVLWMLLEIGGFSMVLIEVCWWMVLFNIDKIWVWIRIKVGDCVFLISGSFLKINCLESMWKYL